MKKRQIPHTYVIIFYIILFCAALTWIIPGGQYTENISPDGERTVVYESVESVPQTWEVLSAFYKGFVDKADIIVFILIIGGAFWIVNDSKAFDIGTVSFLRKARKMENNPILHKIGIDNFLLTAIMLLFSIFGAVFGMSEETIAFCLVLVPMAISMGYDSITGVCMVFIAAGIRFRRSDFKPFHYRYSARLSRNSSFFRHRVSYRLLVYYQCGRLHMDIALCRQGKKEPSIVTSL